MTAVKERLKEEVEVDPDEPLVGDVTPREYLKKLLLFVIVMGVLIFAITHGI
jgi:hypothetical protein